MVPANPKISIIIPSLNQGQFIEESITSILNQTYKNFEIVIIDGGSSDNTISIIKKYASNLAYWISEKDSGQSDAINKGLLKISGDIVTWLNSDDYYEPGTLQLIKDQFLNHPEVDLVHGRAVLFGDHNRPKIIGLEKEIGLPEYLPYMRFPQPASFFSAKAFNQTLLLNQSLHYAMDFELVAKLVLRGMKIKSIPDILSHYRLHQHSKSNDDLKFLNEWSQVVMNIFKSLPDGAFFFQELQKLHLSPASMLSSYPVNITLDQKQQEDIFLQHLDLHFHYNYRFFNAAACRAISKYLDVNYNKFYTDKHYKKYMRRLKFVPKFIFTFIRNRAK